ncbi:hypothetical protein [Phenylobacterium sp.]|jgi:hypothetical protein|uniref:hypothetical protein n=1 Tax=Phenylobacterium sp. TaxID=1871053 RepID=UPI0025E75274|nr:hypothetical protein [Phenylobacterium sp.]MCA6287542.1 hypothetical protein [Phenylobacterium sp.]MCA6289479.1 hypothetical protein [Phenylobacterium sp.]MCA6310078.1 hypothetical protein [Phenylobacterium sp.]MCA6324387.1 hypothetical protein [Phenylobacterium sp.]MCA6336888.1 hypothetical protein [Phenylobacterium sp.]
MLFLMNDWVMQYDQKAMLEDLIGYNLHEVTFPQVLVLGQELYAQDPQLHLGQPLQARKLAALVMAKQPAVNALLFIAPHQGCNPRDVRVRYCSVGYDLLAQLLKLQEDKKSVGWANKEVWNKLGRPARA